VKALTIAAVNLRRLLRDRTSIFFIFALPFLIILAVGATFGEGFTPKLGVAASGSGPLGADLVRRLERVDRLDVRRFQDLDALATAVERGEVEAGLLVPQGYEATVRSGETAALGFLARPGTLGQDLRITVDSVVAEQGMLLRAARFAGSEEGTAFDEALGRASALSREIPAVTVGVSVTGEKLDGDSLGRFDVGASQQLILFMFVTSLGASAQLIETRKLGVSRRMLSTPTAARTVILGEALGRFTVALFQGAVIVFASLALFGVDWGDPLGAAAIVVLFGLVGTGAAMLLGSVLDNSQQAGSLGTFFGLALAALGGCMVPLDVVPDTMRSFAHATPHAWALDGFNALVAKGGTVPDILPQLAVLAAAAAVLLTVAMGRFRRSIIR
jgi:ABC-2 type transport system permease protein